MISPAAINKAVAAIRGKNNATENIINKQKTPITNHEDSSTMLGQSIDLISTTRDVAGSNSLMQHTYSNETLATGHNQTGNDMNIMNSLQSSQ